MDRGFGKVGLVLAAVAIGVDFFSSRRVTIQHGDAGVHVLIRRLWQRKARARDIVIDGATLRYWNAWFCRGLELMGTNVAIAVSGKRGGWLRPPTGVPAVSTRPRFHPTARSVALNLPNILLSAGTIAAVWNVSPYSFLISIVALHSILSSLTVCVLGGPELLVTQLEQERMAPPDHSARAA